MRATIEMVARNFFLESVIKCLTDIIKSDIILISKKIQVE